MSGYSSICAGMIGHYTGVVTQVDSEDRTLQDGTTRKKYRIVLHGASFETWNAWQASLCERSQIQHFPVTVRWKRSDYGNELTGVSQAPLEQTT